MHRNLKLQLNLHQQEHQTDHRVAQLSEKQSSSDESVRDWISAYNTSVITTLSPTTKDRSLELSKLMQSPEFASLLVAAQHLADSQGLSKEVATDRLIRTFREMDHIWNQIVIERGLRALID